MRRRPWRGLETRSPSRRGRPVTGLIGRSRRRSLGGRGGGEVASEVCVCVCVCVWVGVGKV